MRRRPRISIAAIAKDEDPYILEWLGYHLALGFDHIFVYDNMSRSPIKEMLSSIRSRRYVTVLRWEDIPGKDAQLGAYEHYLRTYGHMFEWTAVIDIDEFICLKKHDTIADFLEGFPDANGIAINWRYFGSSGQTHHVPGLVMERFTRAAHVHSGPNQGIKSVYRTREISCLRHHYSECIGSRRIYTSDGSKTDIDFILLTEDSNFEIAQINHYFVKSEEEWERKIRRGYSWVADDASDKFASCDLNDCDDLSILRWKDQTKRWIDRITPLTKRKFSASLLNGLLWIAKTVRKLKPAGRLVLR